MKKKIRRVKEGRCPFCGEEDITKIDYKEVDFVEDGGITQISICYTCNKVWEVYYTPIEISELHYDMF